MSSNRDIAQNINTCSNIYGTSTVPRPVVPNLLWFVANLAFLINLLNFRSKLDQHAFNENFDVGNKLTKKDAVLHSTKINHTQWDNSVHLRESPSRDQAIRAGTHSHFQTRSQVVAESSHILVNHPLQPSSGKWSHFHPPLKLMVAHNEVHPSRTPFSFWNCEPFYIHCTTRFLSKGLL